MQVTMAKGKYDRAAEDAAKVFSKIFVGIAILIGGLFVIAFKSISGLIRDFNDRRKGA